MHPSHAPFLNAIKAAPDDDAPRLVFADWLEIDGPEEQRDAARAAYIRWACTPFERSHMTLIESWLLMSLKPLTEHVLVRCPGGCSNVGVRRGFVEQVWATHDQWFANADALLAEHPVQVVELTTWSPRSTFGMTPEQCRQGVTHEEHRRLATKECEARWPGIRFHLPPGRLPERVPETGWDIRVEVEGQQWSFIDDPGPVRSFATVILSQTVPGIRRFRPGDDFDFRVRNGATTVTGRARLRTSIPDAVRNHTVLEAVGTGAPVVVIG